jgi:diamine N-acetyltransferase
LADVVLRAVDGDTWRGVADLEVTSAQRAFVREGSFYLALCCFGTAGWRPLAVLVEERVIGFLMWAVDPEDGSCWLGGVVVDLAWQGRGYGTRAVRAAIDHLADSGAHRHFALSYHPDNTVARRLYANLGFVETGEMADDELVARLNLDANG